MTAPKQNTLLASSTPAATLSLEDEVRELKDNLIASLRIALNNAHGKDPSEPLKWIEIAQEECELWQRAVERGIRPSEFEMVQNKESNQ